MIHRILAGGISMAALISAGGVAVADTEALASARPLPDQPIEVAQLQPSGAAPEADAPQQAPELAVDELYLEADTFVQDAANARVIASGSVEARYGQRLLRAEKVYYYPDENRITASGDVVVVMEDGSLDFADSAEFSEDFGEGVAVNFASRLANGATAAAAYMERRDEGRETLLTRAIYSACPVCEDSPTPTWRFEARKALHDSDNDMIYYRDVTFHILGVPVLYSPFFAHPDPSVRRRSGFLIPRAGYSTTMGLRLEQPYFWAISPYEDLTISPVFSTEVAPLLGLGFRRQFYSGYIDFDGSITKEQRFASDGTKFGEDKVRGHLFGSGVFAIDEDWSWGFGVERATDFEYIFRYNIREYDAQRGLVDAIPASGYLTTQAFASGKRDDFYASVAAVDFQSLYRGGINDTLPSLLPTAEYRRVFNLQEFGRAEFLADVSALHREMGVDYARISGGLDWRARAVTHPGIVVEPFAVARGDFYRISEAFDPFTGATKDGSPSRIMAYGGVDLTWPFFRPGKVNLTFQPKLQFAGAAGDASPLEDFARTPGNPVTGVIGLPYFEDSFALELNRSNLFDPNRHSGYDLIETGFQANIGAEISADWSSTKRASVFLGRSYHSDPDQFDGASGLDRSWSDYVVEAEVQTRPIVIATRLRIDPDDYKVERFETEGSIRLGPAYLSATYYNLSAAFTGRSSAEYLTVGGTLSLTENVSISYRLSRDLLNNRTQYTSFGMTYEDECFLITGSYVQNQGSVFNSVNEFGGVFLTIGLKTIGAFNIG